LNKIFEDLSEASNQTQITTINPKEKIDIKKHLRNKAKSMFPTKLTLSKTKSSISKQTLILRNSGQGGNRTLTLLLARDFESRVSASSTT
jgi:hypothetical protein